MPPVFGPDVAVVGRLVVLGRLQGDDRPAVGDGQHAGLLAVEPLLDHQAIAGGAEDLLPGDRLDGGDGLLAAGADHHALAGRQPVGLDHDRHVLAVLEELDRRRRRCGRSGSRPWGRRRCATGPCRRPCSLPIRRRPCSGRRSAARPASKASTMPAASGRLGPDDRQLDLVFLGELDQGGEIVGGDGDIFAVQVGAGVARGHEHPLRARTLGDFPGQGVFPPAVANDQDVHQLPS